MNQNGKRYPSDDEESDTMDEQNSDVDRCSSGEDDYDSDDDGELYQEIVNDIRSVAKYEKIEVLTEVIKSRTDQMRIQRQLEVYQFALDVLGGEKLKLQLDLALTTKMLLLLKEALTEQRKEDERVLAQINMSSDFIGDLDMKRVQLIKEIRQVATKVHENRTKNAEAVNERIQEEVNRAIQLQNQLDEVYVSNNELKQLLTESEEARQSLTSTLSGQLNELAKLTGELQEAQERIELEMQTNTKLKENAEMFLAEKTQLATEVVELENRITEQEQAHEAKLELIEQSKNSQLLEMEQLKDAKLAELEQAWKNRYEEEMRNVDVKLTAAKVQADETEKQNAMLNETVEKLRADLESGNKKLEQERERGKELETKIDGIQTLLEDRNNEISSLYNKLSGEHKRVDEERDKIEELYTKLKNLEEDKDRKVKDLEIQLKNAQKEAEANKAKSEQLETDMQNQVAKLTAMESKTAEVDKEQIVLQEKLAAAEKTNCELKQLRVQLAEQKSTIESLEEQLKTKQQEETRKNVENLNNLSSAQITSTPLRLSNSTDSLDIPASKKMRVVDNDAMSIRSSVSNYTSFQGNVDRKRDMSRFFTRKSPGSVQTKRKSDPKSFFNRSAKHNLDDDLISLASTVNLDEEPLETINISSIDSPVPLVKPFFRRQSEKK